MLKGLLHQTVLAGMKSQDRSLSAFFQNSRQFLHQGIQSLIFMIHINPQSLEGTLTGFLDSLFPLCLRNKRKGLFNDILKI